ncbi:hypothetical protein Avbf_09994 [Armadillidium vulgare]|nr:hypothetical protein Avbf_09994 [Armadillidium vulgare]
MEFGMVWTGMRKIEENTMESIMEYNIYNQNETSGSFVRPSKVNLGMSLEQAIKGRYQDDVTIEKYLLLS